MWLMCISQAFFNAINKRDAQDMHWLTSGSYTPGRSFRWLCDAIGLDRDLLLEKLDAAISGQLEVKTSFHVVKYFTDRHWKAEDRGRGKRTPKLRQRLRLAKSS